MHSLRFDASKKADSGLSSNAPKIEMKQTILLSFSLSLQEKVQLRFTTETNPLSMFIPDAHSSSTLR